MFKRHIILLKCLEIIPWIKDNIWKCTEKKGGYWQLKIEKAYRMFNTYRSSNTLPTWCEELTHWKRPWCWEKLKAQGEGDDRGRDGWMASPFWWTWVWTSSGVGDGQGSLACYSPWGCKELYMTEQLNWTKTLSINAWMTMAFQHRYSKLSSLFPPNHACCCCYCC